MYGSKSSTSVLLVTAVVLVRNVCWDVQPVKALFDSGSQISVITKKCLDRLDGKILDGQYEQLHRHGSLFSVFKKF